MRKLYDKIVQYIRKFKQGFGNPDKPANQWKHFTVSVTAFHFIGWILWAAERNPNNMIGLWWFCVIGWLMFIVNFEINQMHAAVQLSREKFAKSLIDKPMTPLEYWQHKWKDSLLDVVAGEIGCVLGLLPFWIM